MKTFRKMNRRDRCEMIARRMGELNTEEAERAWRHLSGGVTGLGELDIPKFENLLSAIRAATIYGKHK